MSKIFLSFSSVVWFWPTLLFFYKYAFIAFWHRLFDWRGHNQQKSQLNFIIDNRGKRKYWKKKSVNELDLYDSICYKNASSVLKICKTIFCNMYFNDHKLVLIFYLIITCWSTDIFCKFMLKCSILCLVK